VYEKAPEMPHLPPGEWASRGIFRLPYPFLPAGGLDKRVMLVYS